MNHLFYSIARSPPVIRSLHGRTIHDGASKED